MPLNARKSNETTTITVTDISLKHNVTKILFFHRSLLLSQPEDDLTVQDMKRLLSRHLDDAQDRADTAHRQTSLQRHGQQEISSTGLHSFLQT